jgi:hypothetical protein
MSIKQEELGDEEAFSATGFTLSPEVINHHYEFLKRKEIEKSKQEKSQSSTMQSIESTKEDALYLIDCGDCHGAEALEVLPEATQSPTFVKHFPQIPPIYWKEGQEG